VPGIVFARLFVCFVKAMRRCFVVAIWLNGNATRASAAVR
jgi:hypothetical protein